MEELEVMFKDFFAQTKIFFTKDELRTKFKIKGEKQTNIFNDTLDKLVEDGCLFFDIKKGYRYFSNDMGMAFGKIEINKSGNGIVHTNNGYKIFVEHNDLNGALNGDRVIVSSIILGKKNEFKGEINKIIKRKDGKVVFEVIGDGYSASLIPYDKNLNINVTINRNQLKKLINGELIMLTVGCECINGSYSAEIEKSLGFISDPNIDIKLLAAKYNISIEFSKEALNEANNLPTEVSQNDLLGRVDLRDKNIITIDCDNTKDRDDAVYVEKLSNGNYKLIVSIASVNYYIKPDSKLFVEALKRGTSHYPNNTCIPMLPKNISNGICSLNENVDRLTKSCEMIIDSEGNVIDYKIYNSVINSKKAMRYSDVNRILNEESISGYDIFKNELEIMNELSDILEMARNRRNYIDFDIPDIKVSQGEVNHDYEFKEQNSGKAEKIIENFMLITNTTIAENYSWLPFIYRIHESPNEQRVKEMIELLNCSKFNIPKIKNINELTIKKILDNAKDSDTMHIIKTYLLRAMKCAKYDVKNVGHFALQLNKYCHFTSPIRRISDFIIHTLIDELDSIEYNEQNIDMLENKLKNISEIASKTEKMDKSFEYEAKAMAMAEYMQNHIGEEFEAYITEIYQYGMFAITSGLILGKIKLDDILGDRYYFDSNKHVIVGKNNKRKFKIGDKICVIVKDASKENRTINFKINKQKSLGI